MKGSGQCGIAAVPNHYSNLHNAEISFNQQFLCLVDADIPQVKAGGKAGLLFEPVVVIGRIVVFDVRQLLDCKGFILIVFADIFDGRGRAVFHQFTV